MPLATFDSIRLCNRGRAGLFRPSLSIRPTYAALKRRSFTVLPSSEAALNFAEVRYSF